ncbi:MAG: adenosylcobinamide-GDP ribazoletransferase [Actinomycetes bacterium]
MTDALRLAVGTLTAFPVPAPRHVDRRTAGHAMLVAPFVGLVLGLVAESAALAVRWLVPGWDDRLLVAVVAVTTLAVLTRGLHLDGLADTADGLGSGRRGLAAVAVMRRSDIGPFGVLTLVLVLLVDVAALDVALLRGRGTVALVGGVVVARLAITWATRSGVPAASDDGLGAAVASTVRPWPLALVTLAVAAFLTVLGVWEDDVTRAFVGQVLGAGLVGIVVSQLLVRHATRRFGGITGDVLGAATEVAFLGFVFVVCIR